MESSRIGSLVSLLLIISVFASGSTASSEPLQNEFLPISDCELITRDEDLSPSSDLQIGIRNLQTRGDIEVLYIKIDFPDLPWESQTDFRLPRLIAKLSSYYGLVSSGKLRIRGNSHDQVIHLQKSLKVYDAGDRKSLSGVVEIVRDSLSLLLEDIERTDFDYVIIAPPSSTEITDISTSISYMDGEYFPNSTILAGDYWQSGEPWTIPAHEMGHAFGLLDLYNYESAAKVSKGLASNSSQFNFMGPYELMNNPMGPGPELDAWNRWQLGFLNENEVGCIKMGKSIFTLYPVSRSGWLRALFIKLNDAKLLVIENRQRTGLDKKLPAKSVGLIVYLVNLERGSGTGQQRIIVVRNKSGLGKYTVQVGEKVIYHQFIIKNLSSNQGKVEVLVKTMKPREERHNLFQGITRELLST